MTEKPYGKKDLRSFVIFDNILLPIQNTLLDIAMIMVVVK